jgi:hypothetical protein
MSTRFQIVAASLRLPAILLVCVIIGCAIVDIAHVIWPIVISACILGCLAAVKYYKPAPPPAYTSDSSRSGQYIHTEEAARLVQDLIGPYPRYAAAAATQLGEIRDGAAVPSLISVLDRSAWRSETGWDAVSEAIVRALALIGDGRALSVLNRVRMARGVEFTEAVDDAIASITSMSPLDMRTRAARPNEAYQTQAPAGNQQPVPARKPRISLTGEEIM